jgi:hypothetical protein
MPFAAAAFSRLPTGRLVCGKRAAYLLAERGSMVRAVTPGAERETAETVPNRDSASAPAAARTDQRFMCNV